MAEALDGRIASVGFASGDRFVVGWWDRSPLGPMADVMWADPHGRRTLLAPRVEVADYITAIYDFDRVQVTGVVIEGDTHQLQVRAGGLELDLQAGRGVRLPLRPTGFVRWVEGPIARAVLGVRTYGTSPTGVVECYRARTWQRVRGATARLDGRDLGRFGSARPAVRFGFSEPPRVASVVGVRVEIHRPGGEERSAPAGSV